MILGTAGHIDHGKTTLVRALTGVDTDRLPEEKRRGITIELGFAPLELEGVETIGVVDVPGHEAFVRTMLAGATGVDVALIVVAADEGVMPQTREHLAILALLGVRAGVVAITKRELVDEDWLSLVVEDVRATLADGPLGDSPVVAVSAVTGDGLPELRDALRDAALRVPERNDADLFRMPIDRVFTVKGTGTVVTGTVWSGTLATEGHVRIMPAGIDARVRGIQSHGAMVPVARPGRRVALSLAGAEREDVERGGWIVADPRWTTTTVLRADVALLDGVAPLGPRSRVRFHLGTQDVGARIVARGGALAAGSVRPVRIVCDAPVLARGGDRFVLRAASPAVTIGGGTVTDAAPGGRRVRPSAKVLPTLHDRLAAIVDDAGAAAVQISSFAFRAGLPANEIESAIRLLGDDVTALGGAVVATQALDRVRDTLLGAVGGYHARHPLESGAPLQVLRASAAGVSPAVVEAALKSLELRGDIVIDGSAARITGWNPSLANGNERLAAEVTRVLADASKEPPSVAELSAALGSDVVPVLRFLERAGRVTPVDQDRYYDSKALEGLLATLKVGMDAGREYGPAELREVLGLSRKYLIPFLEYCDRTGITERRLGGRVRLGT
jgi:selenocysteine-specific elongation factor